MSLTDIPGLTNSTPKYRIHAFHPPPSQQLALPLHIPPCHQSPPHLLHLPSPDHPLQVQVEGHLIAIQKLLPTTSWYTADHNPMLPMPGGPELAKLAFQIIYHREVQPNVPGNTGHSCRVYRLAGRTQTARVWAYLIKCWSLRSYTNMWSC